MILNVKKMVYKERKTKHELKYSLTNVKHNVV